MQLLRMLVMLDHLLIQSLAAASMATTLSKGHTGTFIRERLNARVLKDLFACPYCLVHWIAGIMQLPLLWRADLGVYVQTVFAQVAISTFIFSGIIAVMKKVSTGE